MKCPSCHTETMIKKDYESVEIDLCRSCLGVWLDEGELQSIVSDRTLKFSPEHIRKTLQQTFAGIPKAEREKEKRPCPKCHKELNPLNYSYDSGIIIDTCSAGHGIWLDKNELEKIQHFREYWQDNTQENQSSLTKLIENVDKKSSKQDKQYTSLLFSIAVEASELLFGKNPNK